MSKWKRISAIVTLVTSIPFLIGAFIIMPVMLIVVAIACGGNAAAADDEFDIWDSVKNEVKFEEALENDISSWLLSYTFDTLNGYIEDTDREVIKEFIVTQMCVTESDETVNHFLTLQELLNKLKRELNDEQYYDFVQQVKLYFLFEPIEDGKYPYPLEEFNITSPYGSRPNPTGEGTSFHNGMDMASSNPYAPIISISDGEVVKVNTQKSGLGNYTIIKYEDDNSNIFFGVYGHMSGILVELGDEVEQGEVIGFQGGNPDVDPNAGDTTGRHLHFEIRIEAFISSTSVDPAKYLFISNIME